MSRSAALIVRANFRRIERNDSHPADTGIPEMTARIRVSRSGLKMPMKIAKGETREHLLHDEEDRDFAQGHQQDREEKERDQRRDFVLGKGDDGGEIEHRRDHLGPRVQAVDPGLLIGEPVQPADIEIFLVKRHWFATYFSPGRIGSPRR